MKKKEFLDELDKVLTKRNYPDKEDVIKDFEEHFRIGEEEGKSEEEIAKLLGNPDDIADQFKEEEIEEKTEVKKENETEVQKENDGLTKLVLALALIFFNITIVLGVAVGMLGAMFGFFIAGIAIAVAGIALIIVGILRTNTWNFNFTNILNFTYYAIWWNWNNSTSEYLQRC